MKMEEAMAAAEKD
jgi:hypothetical protein